MLINSSLNEEVKTMLITMLHIDGAVVMPELKKVNVNGEAAYQLPKTNPMYCFAALINGMPMASKDGREFVVAIAINVGGKMFSASEFIESFNRNKDK